MVPTTVIELVPQVSMAVGGSKVQRLPHSTVFGAAQTIVGGVVSLTRTACEQVFELPHRSLTLQVRKARKVCPHKRFVVVLKI